MGRSGTYAHVLYNSCYIINLKLPSTFIHTIFFYQYASIVTHLEF